MKQRAHQFSIPAQIGIGLTLTAIGALFIVWGIWGVFAATTLAIGQRILFGVLAFPVGGFLLYAGVGGLTILLFDFIRRQ